MSSFTTIDLSALAPPNVVDELSFETVLNELLADLVGRYPEFSAMVESDPGMKVLEVAAYRELLLRAKANDDAKAVFLALATGADLDQLGANYHLQRLVLDPGDPDAIPPIEPTYELDDDFRNRIQLSFEGYTVAGSEGAYVFHGLSADADVKDIQAVSPTPGAVTVYVLSRTGDGTASTELCNTVDASLNADTVRPLTDNVTVMSAAIIDYAIEAELVLYPGPDSEVVRQAAEDALTEYTANVHRIGYDVTLSGVLGALHQPGVQRVVLEGVTPTPVAGRLVEVTEGEAPYCTAITVTVAGATDV